MNGFLGGGQIGYNYQIGWVVLGIGGSFDWAGIKGDGPAKGLTFTSKTDWIATVTGRIGGTTTRQGLITTLIGESSYRNKGALSAARVPFYDYLFDTLRLKMILATALTRNDILMKAMLKHGWKLDQTLKNHVKSNSDGTMLDLCLFSLTRDAHRAWK